MKKKRRPLSLKLAFFATVLVVFVAATFGFGILLGQKKAIMRAQHENRVETLNGLRQVAREAILVSDDTHIVNYINLLKRSPLINYAMFINPDGRIRVHSDPSLIDKKLTDPATKKALQNRNRNTPLTQNITTADGRDIIDLSVPLTIGFSPPEFHGIARIGFDRQNIEHEIDIAVRHSTQGILFAFLVALLVGIVGAFLLAAFITKPIRALMEGSRMIGKGQLGHRIEVRSNDELKDLADEFNRMGEKLSELDEMKRDFVSNVTHELRSPMTSIRGYMDLLLQGAAGKLTDMQKDYLSVIKNNAVRLGRFIDNLLDVSKIEAQKLNLKPEPVRMSDLAHEMEILFKPQMGEKKIRLRNTVPANMTEGFVDRDKAAEVFINLTSNAVKFTPEGGDIVLDGREEDNHLKMSVQDSGVGIPPDQVGKLFSKFEQVRRKETAGKLTQKGTGLGLTIVKGIVEAHGGKIWVESPGPSGKGTAFYFTLPKMTEELRQRWEDRT